MSTPGELSEPCAWCGARVGQRCRSMGRPLTQHLVHPSRADAVGLPGSRNRRLNDDTPAEAPQVAQDRTEPDPW